MEGVTGNFLGKPGITKIPAAPRRAASWAIFWNFLNVLNLEYLTVRRRSLPQVTEGTRHYALYCRVRLVLVAAGGGGGLSDALGLLLAKPGRIWAEHSPSKRPEGLVQLCGCNQVRSWRPVPIQPQCHDSSARGQDGFVRGGARSRLCHDRDLSRCPGREPSGATKRRRLTSPDRRQRAMDRAVHRDQWESSRFKAPG